MSTQRAIVIQGPGDARVVSDAPVPQATEDFVKVKTVAVALNPSDWKHIDLRADRGAVCGFDYAGYVEEIGPLVEKDYKKGDRIAGFTHGCNVLHSSFHTLAKALEEGTRLTIDNAANTLNHSTGAFCRAYHWERRHCFEAAREHEFRRRCDPWCGSHYNRLVTL